MFSYVEVHVSEGVMFYFSCVLTPRYVFSSPIDQLQHSRGEALRTGVLFRPKQGQNQTARESRAAREGLVDFSITSECRFASSQQGLERVGFVSFVTGPANCKFGVIWI